MAVWQVHNFKDEDNKMSKFPARQSVAAFAAWDSFPQSLKLALTATKDILNKVFRYSIATKQSFLKHGSNNYQVNPPKCLFQEDFSEYKGSNMMS